MFSKSVKITCTGRLSHFFHTYAHVFPCLPNCCKIQSKRKEKREKKKKRGDKREVRKSDKR